MTTGIPVIIDTDIGTDIDDTWALAMALGCDEIDVQLVTTCTGDTRARAQITARFLEASSRAHIPIGIGLEFEPTPLPQSPWVEGYDLTDYPGPVYEDGVAAMADVIKQAEGMVTLVAIGPLPNVASLLTRYPELATKIRFVGMHGSIYRGYQGSTEVHAEYNVKLHVDAAQVVFSSDMDIVITPLDTCGLVRLKGEQYQRFVAGAVRGGLKALHENYRLWLQTIGKDVAIADEKSSTLFDTVAIYLAFSDELLEMESLKIVIDEEGYTRTNDLGKTMQVAVRWKDQVSFQRFLVDRLLLAP